MVDRYNDSIYFRFQAAIEGMAVSPEPLSARLANAYLHVFVIREQDFPVEVQEPFRRLGEQLTRLKDHSGKLGDVYMTAHALSDSESEELAREFLRIYDMVVADYHAHLEDNR